LSRGLQIFALVVQNVHISAHSCGRFRAYGGKRYASGHARGPLHPSRRSWVHRPEFRLVRSAANVSKSTVFSRFQLTGGAAQCSGRMCRLAAVPWVISPLVQLLPDPPNCPTHQRRRYAADQLQASVSAADNLTALALADTLFRRRPSHQRVRDQSGRSSDCETEGYGGDHEQWASAGADGVLP
jgi:hypothetical protein